MAGQPGRTPREEAERIYPEALADGRLLLAASKEEPKENLDTAGVMMTKPSNMSSESVDPLIQLKRLLK